MNAHLIVLIPEQEPTNASWRPRQVPFHLPGGAKYVVDFVEFRADGTVHFIDVKGKETESFRAKKRMVESLYAPIEIEVVM